MNADAVRYLYDTLMSCYGPQGWWPAESKIEMACGAILVQNTNWTNANRAISNLHNALLLNHQAILDCPIDQLEMLVRPSGFFRQKASRLKNFCRWLVEHGDFDELRRHKTTHLRRSLLELNGIGPETADCILLYAFERPHFIADGYARRLLSRMGLIGRSDATDYEKIRLQVEKTARMDSATLNEFHALLVAHGKKVCRKQPDCGTCVLAKECCFLTECRLSTGPTGRQN